jgi:hypothetical protein
MLESCARLRRQNPDQAADTLITLITDIRRVLVNMDMGNARKLTSVQAIVDTVAPPPDPSPLFTDRAATATGEPLHAVLASRIVVDTADYPELQADVPCALRRDGHLVTPTGEPVAKIASVYLPARIPPAAARALITTQTPLGAALAPYGVRREELPEQDGQTRGILWLGSRPVALAWEKPCDMLLVSAPEPREGKPS